MCGGNFSGWVDVKCSYSLQTPVEPQIIRSRPRNPLSLAFWVWLRGKRAQAAKKVKAPEKPWSRDVMRLRRRGGSASRGRMGGQMGISLFPKCRAKTLLAHIINIFYFFLDPWAHSCTFSAARVGGRPCAMSASPAEQRPVPSCSSTLVRHTSCVGVPQSCTWDSTHCIDGELRWTRACSALALR